MLYTSELDSLLVQIVDFFAGYRKKAVDDLAKLYRELSVYGAYLSYSVIDELIDRIIVMQNSSRENIFLKIILKLEPENTLPGIITHTAARSTNGKACACYEVRYSAEIVIQDT